MSQGIGREKGERVNAVIYLTKAEKRFLEALSERIERAREKRSGTSATIAACVRLAFRCILYHHSETPDQEPMSVEELRELGLDLRDGFFVETPED